MNSDFYWRSERCVRIIGHVHISNAGEMIYPFVGAYKSDHFYIKNKNPNLKCKIWSKW